MSDITATNCGCERECGCGNCGGGCGGNCGCDSSCLNTNGSCNLLWLIILLSFMGNGSCGGCGCGSPFGGCGGNCGCGGNDNYCFLILLLFFCGGWGNGSCC